MPDWGMLIDVLGELIGTVLWAVFALAVTASALSLLALPPVLLWALVSWLTCGHRSMGMAPDSPSTDTLASDGWPAQGPSPTSQAGSSPAR